MPESRLTVLIAEDGAADRLLLARIVSKQGHAVLTAENGEQAVALFVQRRPHLVLLDALMPVMDGFEAARQIKALAGEALVPIIFLTSLSEEQALVKCLEAGGGRFSGKTLPSGDPGRQDQGHGSPAPLAGHGAGAA